MGWRSHTPPPGAQDTWEKVLDGTLRGASIGASNVEWRTERREGVALQLLDDLRKLLSLPESRTSQEYFSFFKRLRSEFVSPFAQRELLGQFLRQTATETLELLKLRMESCSRALLGRMIARARLRQPFVQAEIPLELPPSSVPGSAGQQRFAQARYTISRFAPEVRLQGYITLVAAKLPLIDDVERFLQDSLDQLTAQTSSLPMPQDITQTLSSTAHSWRALLQGVHNDVLALQRANEQDYMNQMLSNRDDARAEEETMAEIGRIRERIASSLSPASNLAVNVLSNMIAIAGLLVALASVGVKPQAVTSLLSQINLPEPVLAVLVVVGIGVIIVVVLVLSLALQAMTEPLVKLFTKLRWLRQQRDEQYFYGMNVRLDTILTEESAGALLRGDFTNDLSPWADVRPHLRRRHPHVDHSRGHAPKRNSYRVSRETLEEAVHEIYVVASVWWPGDGWFILRWLRVRRMQVFLVYDVLTYTPSSTPVFAMTTLRILSGSEKILSPAQILELQQLLMSEFVNRWIEDKRDHIVSDDSLMELPVVSLQGDRIGGRFRH
jgi:hypothetical protein